MDSSAPYHIASAVFVFAGGAVPFYLSFKLSGSLRSLTVALSVFIFIHGAYHVLGSMGYDFISQDILEPISAAALIFFGLLYLIIIRKSKSESNQAKVSQ